MAKGRKVSDIATQRGTSVDDVLAHLKKAGIEVVDGEVSVDEEAIEKAYAAPAGRRCAAVPAAARPARSAASSSTQAPHVGATRAAAATGVAGAAAAATARAAGGARRAHRSGEGAVWVQRQGRLPAARHLHAGDHQGAHGLRRDGHHHADAQRRGHRGACHRLQP